MISPPRAETACTLISGVVSGITMTAGIPRVRAARATPCAWLPAEFRCVFVGMIVVIAVQYDFAAEIRYSLDLDLRRGQRHDNDRRDPPSAGCERNPLRMIAG